jgi:hypothetical protein
VTELLDVTPPSVKIRRSYRHTWIVEPYYAAEFVVSNTTTYGTARFRATDSIEQSLNGRTPTAFVEHPLRQSDFADMQR